MGFTSTERIQLIQHPNTEALASAVATEIGSALDAALAARPRSALALAGGRTAPPIFRKLAAQPRDWRRVTVVPTDERWVPTTHADHNLRQMRTAFGAVAGSIEWLGLVPELPIGAPDPEFANDTLAQHSAPFDLTLLGLGSDGHFASLFPHAGGLEPALDLRNRDPAIAMRPDPLPAMGPHLRISLTLRRLLTTRRMLLAIAGADKLAVLERAQQAGADPLALPAAALLRVPGLKMAIHWSP